MEIERLNNQAIRPPHSDQVQQNAAVQAARALREAAANADGASGPMDKVEISDRSRDLARAQEAVDTALDTVLTSRARVGSATNRLEASRDRLLLDQVNTTRQLSLVEDVDFAQAASEFAVQETVYKAALAASSKAIQPSLLDYLR